MSSPLQARAHSSMPPQILLLLILLIHSSSSSTIASSAPPPKLIAAAATTKRISAITSTSSAFINHGSAGNKNITLLQKRQQQQQQQQKRTTELMAFNRPYQNGIISNKNNGNDKRQKNIFPSNHFPRVIGGASPTTPAAILRKNNNISPRLFASQSSITNNDDNNNNNNNDKNTSKTNVKKSITTALTITALTTLLILNRQSLPTPNQIRNALVTFLDYLASLGTPGLVIYAISLSIWEMTFGITTPVETAAGMAFGVKNGIIANACGKITGAILSYSLGKYILRSRVHEALSKNEMLTLIEDDIQEHPLKVALIWRFSPLPEFVKNFGLSILEPLRTRVFILAVMLHGFPFTCLWTCLGNETGLLLRGVVDGPSKTLKILVSGVTWFGFLVSPTLVGMWVKGLRDKQIEKNKFKEEEEGIDSMDL